MWLPYRSSAIILFVRTAGSGNTVVQTVVLVVLGVGDLCKCWMKVIRQHVLETQLHFLSVLPVSCLPSPCFAQGLKALEEVKVNTRLPPPRVGALRLQHVCRTAALAPAPTCGLAPSSAMLTSLGRSGQQHSARSATNTAPLRTSCPDFGLGFRLRVLGKIHERA